MLYQKNNKSMNLPRDIKKLPYRDNVSCVVYKNNVFLLLQRKGWPNNWWKFPQGGIDMGEPVEEAAIRELKEEVGSDNFKVIGLSKNYNVYDWNDESVRLAGYRWRGQNQRYLLIEYLGEEDEISLNPHEIEAYEWVKLDDVWCKIDHNDENFCNYKETIKKVLREFNFY